MRTDETIELRRRWKRKKYAYGYSRNFQTLEDFSVLPLVFLTGPAGSGKTTDIDRYRNSTLVKSKVLYYTFGELEKREDFTEWIKKSLATKQELYIDAYDERLTTYRREKVVEPLRELSHTGRLPNLRVVSRDNHIDTDFIEEIGRIYEISSDEIAQYELDDLNEEEIQHFASQRLGPKASTFLKQAEELELSRLLNRPYDIDAFVAIYEKQGSLGGSPDEAWEQAIRFELEELKEAKADRRCSVDEKLKILKVLAIWRVVCLLERERTSAFNVDEVFNLWDAVAPDFTDYDIAWFKTCIRQTLDSTLFEFGGGIYTFKSIAKIQFLAAKVLNSQPTSQLIDLFKDQLEGCRISQPAKIVVAELTKHNEELFDWVLKNDPQTFLHAVLPTFTNTQTSNIALALLETADELFPWSNFGNLFRGVEKEKLLDEVTSTISSPNFSEQTRYVALNIIESNQWIEPLEAITSLAFDKSQTYELRQYATRCMCNLGDSSRSVLKELCRIKIEDDEDNQILGIAMSQIWPSEFGAEEAFEILREPKKDHFGSYRNFFRNAAFEEILKIEHVEPGLAFIGEFAKHHSRGRKDFERLEKALVKLAWDNLNLPACLQALAKYIQSRFDQSEYEPLAFKARNPYNQSQLSEIAVTEEEFISSAEKRFELFLAWTRLEPDHKHLAQGSDLISASNQFDLLLDIAENSPNNSLLVDILRHQVSKLLSRQENSVFEPFEPRLLRLEIDLGEMRRIAKVQTDRLAEFSIRETSIQQKDDESDARFQEQLLHLANSEDVKFQDWLNLFTFDDIFDYHLLKPAQWNRWPKIPQNIRSQIIASAIEYISSSTPIRMRDLEGRWIATHAFLVAISIVLEVDPAYRPGDPFGWTLYLYYLQCYLTGEAEVLFVIGDSLSSDQKLEIFRLLYQNEKPDEGCYYAPPFHRLLDDKLLISLARVSREWSENLRRFSLCVIEQRDRQLFVEEAIVDMSSDRPERKQFLIECILWKNISEGFPLINDLIDLEPTLIAVLRDAIENSFRLINHPVLFSKLQTEHLVRLFDLAYGKPDISFIAHKRSPDLVFHYLLGAILTRYDTPGVAFFEKWVSSSDLTWIKNFRFRKRNEWIESHWTPPNARELFAFIRHPNRKLIRTPKDLHDLVLLGLELIQNSEQNNRLYRQKDRLTRSLEPDITANIAQSLRAVLATKIVNTEVQCPSGRTDIQIETFSELSGQRLKCIVEAKPCDANPENVISGQLLPRYLSSDEQSTGIVLVLWFCKNLTPSSASRKRANLKESKRSEPCSACKNKQQIKETMAVEAASSERLISIVHYEIT